MSLISCVIKTDYPLMFYFIELLCSAVVRDSSSSQCWPCITNVWVSDQTTHVEPRNATA